VETSGKNLPQPPSKSFVFHEETTLAMKLLVCFALLSCLYRFVCALCVTCFALLYVALYCFDLLSCALYVSASLCGTLISAAFDVRLLCFRLLCVALFVVCCCTLCALLCF
jgi:hypothetical protein